MPEDFGMAVGSSCWDQKREQKKKVNRSHALCLMRVSLSSVYHFLPAFAVCVILVPIRDYAPRECHGSCSKKRNKSVRSANTESRGITITYYVIILRLQHESRMIKQSTGLPLDCGFSSAVDLGNWGQVICQFLRLLTWLNQNMEESCLTNIWHPALGIYKLTPDTLECEKWRKR